MRLLRLAMGIVIAAAMGAGQTSPNSKVSPLILETGQSFAGYVIVFQPGLDPAV